MNAILRQIRKYKKYLGLGFPPFQYYQFRLIIIVFIDRKTKIYLNVL